MTKEEKLRALDKALNLLSLVISAIEIGYLIGRKDRGTPNA